MKHLQRSIKAVVYEGNESGYVGTCYDLPVVTQGATLDEVVNNLQEAISLHLEDENKAELGYVDNPGIIITYELDTVYAQA